MGYAVRSRTGGVAAMMTYYDNNLGKTRYKRRYVWAGWAFVAGLALGVAIGHLF